MARYKKDGTKVINSRAKGGNSYFYDADLQAYIGLLWDKKGNVKAMFAVDEGVYLEFRDIRLSFHNAGYVERNGSSRYLLHRHILKAPIGSRVDHRNHNRLDNRSLNIHITDNVGNSRNLRPKPTSRSGLKGVHFSKNCKDRNWCAQSIINKKKKTIGYFATKEEAAKAYDEYVRQNTLHPEMEYYNYA